MVVENEVLVFVGLLFTTGATVVLVLPNKYITNIINTITNITISVFFSVHYYIIRYLNKKGAYCILVI